MSAPKSFTAKAGSNAVHSTPAPVDEVPTQSSVQLTGPVSANSEAAFAGHALSQPAVTFSELLAHLNKAQASSYALNYWIEGNQYHDPYDAVDPSSIPIAILADKGTENLAESVSDTGATKDE